jgi:hypothetical protein
LNTGANNLEIGRKITIHRKRDVLSLPEDELIEELRKRIFFEVKNRERVRKDTLFNILLERIPVDVKVLEEALATLIDEGKLASEDDYIFLPKRIGERIVQKKLILDYEGTGEDAKDWVDGEIEEKEALEDIKVEFMDVLNKEEIRSILSHIGKYRIHIRGRRRIE